MTRLIRRKIRNLRIRKRQSCLIICVVRMLWSLKLQWKLQWYNNNQKKTNNRDVFKSWFLKMARRSKLHQTLTFKIMNWKEIIYTTQPRHLQQIYLKINHSYPLSKFQPNLAALYTSQFHLIGGMLTQLYLHPMFHRQRENSKVVPKAKAVNQTVQEVRIV